MNAREPILVTLSGIVAYRSRVQPLNASSPMISTPSRTVRLRSSSHHLNALSPTVFTLPGISADSSPERINAPSPISVTPSGIFSSVRAPHSAKPYAPMRARPSGRAAAFSFPQPSKAQSPIDVTPSFTTAFFICFLWEYQGECSPFAVSGMAPSPLMVSVPFLSSFQLSGPKAPEVFDAANASAGNAAAMNSAAARNRTIFFMSDPPRVEIGLRRSTGRNGITAPAR